MFHYFFTDDPVNFLFQRVLWRVVCAKSLHESGHAVSQIGRIDSRCNCRTQRGSLQKTVHQRLHAQLMHVGFHVDVIHLPVLHVGVHLVVQEAHLHVGRQLGAPQQVVVRFVVRGAAHLYYFPVHLERRHNLVKQRCAQFGFHVFDDVLHPRARAVVVGVNHDPAALVGLLLPFQKPQDVHDVRSQEFRERIH